MAGEELRCHDAPGGLLGDGLGAVLAELGDLAPAVFLRPRTARAVEPLALVQPEQRRRGAKHAHRFEAALQGHDDRLDADRLTLRRRDRDRVFVVVDVDVCPDGRPGGHRPNLCRRRLRSPPMADITALVTGRAFLEGPRWHDGALYVSDMHGDAVLRITEDGEVSTVVEVEQPSGLGWLPDGSLLISSMTPRKVMRFDGSGLGVHGDLSSLAPYEINDMCVDRHGHAFIGQFGFDYAGRGTPAAAALTRVDPDGSGCEVADNLEFANGMVITADQSTLLVAESFGQRITGFDLADDGSLSQRRGGGGAL